MTISWDLICHRKEKQKKQQQPLIVFVISILDKLLIRYNLGILLLCDESNYTLCYNNALNNSDVLPKIEPAVPVFSKVVIEKAQYDLFSSDWK